MLIHIPFKTFYMLKVKFYTIMHHLHYPTSDITIIGQLAFDVSWQILFYSLTKFVSVYVITLSVRMFDDNMFLSSLLEQKYFGFY